MAIGIFMKKIICFMYILAITTCFAEITLTTEMDQKNCNFAVQVKEDSNTLFSETMHISGQFGRSACFDSWIEACLINQKDAAFINGMKENRSKSFTNSKGQICFFDNLSLSTGNMGCFTSRPDHVYGVNAKVSCVDTTSTPLYCAKNEKLAKQVLLVKQELECKEKDGVFQGDVYAFEQEDGSTEYCISASCDICGSEWFEEYVNQRKQSECCEKLGKEPNQGNGMCESPLPPSSSEIGVSYSQIKNFPGCSNITAGEGDKFCKVQQSSSSSEKSSSSQGSSSSSDQSSSSENSSSSSESSSSSMDKSSSSSAESSSSKESSSSAESSSSEESSSSAESSSSEESSSSVESSSSEESSSSAESSSSDESSSSAESSSSENSSSSAKSSSSESSSSETGLCKTLPVDKIPYNAKSACFKNNGHCYKCKAGINESDCQNSWSWQNPNTPVNTYHWFNEVNCATGEKTDQGIGVCPAQPLDAIPSDLSNACFAMDGKCYKCKDPSPYGGCAQSWIWTQKLYYAEPYYLEEVDCYDPFEIHSKQCPDGNALMKRASDYEYAENASDDRYNIDFTNNIKYYNILGRKTSRANSVKQVLYRKSTDNFYKKSADQLQQTIENIFEKINQGYNKRGLFKRNDCGLLGGDYGIIEPDGSRTGGITCPDAEPRFSKPKVLKSKFLEETCIIKDCEYKKVWVKVGTTLQMTLISIKDTVVEIGFVFPDGYVTTKEDHEAVKKHEKGHVKDFECIAKKFPKEKKYIEVEVEACNEDSVLNAAIKEKVKPYLEEMQSNFDKRADEATRRYHKTYSSFDYPKGKYECPSDL